MKKLDSIFQQFLVNIYNVRKLVKTSAREMTRKKSIIITSCLIIAAILIAYLVFSALISNSTTVYVNPQKINRAVDQDFIINVSISRVSDLYAWEFKLNWTSSILSVVNVTEGPFLKAGGTTSFSYNNALQGHVRVWCTLSGNVSGVNGSGVLAKIQFHVTGSGESKLDLYETTLFNPSENSIANTLKGGEFST
jgi:hypothetical protein